MVQGLRLFFQCRGPGWIPGQGTRSHRAQLRAGTAKQTNKQTFLFKKRENIEDQSRRSKILPRTVPERRNRENKEEKYYFKKCILLSDRNQSEKPA